MTGGRYSQETVGEYLKRERESRRISLEEISKGTRISRPYLEALERNDFRFFSRSEYVQGFLSGYARSIGIEPSEVLKRYELQMDLVRLQGNFRQLPLFSSADGGSEVEAEKQEGPVSSPRREKTPFSRSIVVQVVILTAALALSFYLYITLKQLDQDGPPKKLATTATEEVRPGTENKGVLEPAATNAGKAKAPERDPAKEVANSLAPASAPANGKGTKDSRKTAAATSKGRIHGDPKSKTYYLPGMKNYENKKGEKRVSFDTEEEAIKKGYRRSPR